MDVQRFSATELSDALAAELLSGADAVAANDGVDPLSEQARLRLRHRDEATHLVIPEVAYAQLSTEGDVVTVEGYVLPASRRVGAATTLARRVTETARGRVMAWAHGDAPGAAKVAAEFGAHRARELWMMKRENTPVAAAEPPDGVRLRPFVPGRDDAEWLAVNAAAFATHPEQGRWTARDLAERLAEPWFDADGFILAQDAEGVAGFHWTKIVDGVGEVYVVGIAPRAQGRGLGGVLTRAGLRHMLDHGVKDIELYVDADNTAAVRLYRSLGFEVATVDVQYALGRPVAR